MSGSYLSIPETGLTQRKGQKKNDDLAVNIGAPYSPIDGSESAAASSMCVTIIGVLFTVLFAVAIIVAGVSLWRLDHGFRTPWLIATNITAENALNGTDATITLIRAGEIWVNDLHGNRSVFVNSTTQNLWATDIYTSRLNSTNISSVLIWTNSIHGNAATFVNVTAVSIWANDIHTNILTANAITTNTLVANAITTNTLGANAITTNTIQGNTATFVNVQATNVTAENTWTDRIHGNSANFTEIEARTLAVENLTVVNQLSLPCPEGGRVLEVGSGKPYPTIKSAIDTFNRLRACPRTTFKLSPGVYVNDPIELTRGSGAMEDGPSFKPKQFAPGLEFVGDVRVAVGHALVNGQRLMSQGKSGQWEVSTNVPGVGPFYSAISPVWSENPTPFEVTLEAVIADPLEACTAITNSGAVAGKIALIKRGTCLFSTKATNTGNAGAAHTVIFDTSGAPNLNTLGSSKPANQTGAFVYLSFADGEAIYNAIQASATPVTLTLKLGALYSPALGTPRGNVTLSHPAGDLTKIRASINDIPAGSTLDQPNFVAAGIVPGDKIRVVHRVPGGFDIFGFYTSSTYERTVASVSPQELTLTQPLTQSIDWDYGTSITLLPNVRVLQYHSGAESRAALSVSGASAAFSGILFDESTTAAFGQGEAIVAISYGAVNFNRVVVNQATYRTTHAISMNNGRLLNNAEASPFLGSPNVVFGQIYARSSSVVQAYLTIPYSYTNGLIGYDSNVLAGSVSVNWVGADGSPRLGLDFYTSRVLLDGDLTLDRSQTASIRADSATRMTIGAFGEGKIRHGGIYALFGYHAGAIQASGGSQVQIYKPMSVIDHITGLVSTSASSIYFEKTAPLTLQDIYLPPLVASDSSTLFVSNSSNINANVRTTSASGLVQSAHAIQIMTGTEQTLTLNTGETIEVRGETMNGDFNVHIGRKYTIVNRGTNNTLSLASGAFHGKNVASSGSSNTYEFPNVADYCLTVEVISASEVLVCDGGEAGVWSTAVKKNVVPAKKMVQSPNAPMGGIDAEDGRMAPVP